MTATVLVGAQWGDEGKGKLVDLMSERVDMVVRYQGGNNAGHTIVVGDRKLSLHLVPSGILHPGTQCVLGSGVVIDPTVLAGELAGLRDQGIDTSGLRVSAGAHVIMPYHVALDAASEERLDATPGAAIGTTRRGIGPCYTDKASRLGVSTGELWRGGEPLRKRVARALERANTLLVHLYGADPLDLDDVMGWAEQAAKVFGGAPDGAQLVDVSKLINEALDQGSDVLFEGAQGTLLDIDHGTYPYVTSSHPIAGGACVGSGVGPTRIDRVIGVAKAYTTRVGSGPFPTELDDDVAEHLVKVGHEFGTTTGRRRRVGWLDLVALRTAVRLNGLTDIALTKLDVMGGLDRVALCTAYTYPGMEKADARYMPGRLETLEAAQPVLEWVDGWDAGVADVRSAEQLPASVQAFVSLIEEEVGVPVTMLGLGQDREALVSLQRRPGALQVG